LDWPDDVVELADDLHIDRFAVAGFSGGAPYAFACAFKIPHRLIDCGLISGVGHTGRFRSVLSKWLPWLLLPLSKRFFQDEERAKRTLAKASRTWVESDRKALSSPGVIEVSAASLVEGLRQGAKGAAYEGRLPGGRDWGCKLEDISFQKLYLWHGELDKDIPLAPARQIAERLAQCRAAYYPDEGHISVIVNHQEDIVKALLSRMFNKSEFGKDRACPKVANSASPM
jgi:pimeloyl-ACP methyl ester carboxylesterase